LIALVYAGRAGSSRGVVMVDPAPITNEAVKGFS
jgi:hypothetical protein